MATKRLEGMRMHFFAENPSGNLANWAAKPFSRAHRSDLASEPTISGLSAAQTAKHQVKQKTRPSRSRKPSIRTLKPGDFSPKNPVFGS